MFDDSYTDIILFEDMNMLADIYESELAVSTLRENQIVAEHMYQKTGLSEILMEAMIDSNNTIVHALGVMIDKIKKFFNNILMYMNTYTMEMDKFIKKYKTELNAINGVDFRIEGYNFTVLGSKGPNMRPLEDVVASYNSLVTTCEKMDLPLLKKEQLDYFSEENLRKLRTDIAHLSVPVDEEDFVEEVRKMFRGQQIEVTPIQVNDAYVKGIISNNTTLVKAKNDSIKDRDQLLILLTKTKTFFEQKVPIMYSKSGNKMKASTVSITNNKFNTDDAIEKNHDAELYRKLDTLLSFKYQQVNKLAGMMNLVASERANALKDQVKQEYSIIRHCLFGKTSDVTEGFLMEYNVNSRTVMEGTLEVGE